MPNAEDSEVRAKNFGVHAKDSVVCAKGSKRLRRTFELTRRTIFRCGKHWSLCEELFSQSLYCGAHALYVEGRAECSENFVEYFKLYAEYFATNSIHYKLFLNTMRKIQKTLQKILIKLAETGTYLLQLPQ